MDLGFWSIGHQYHSIVIIRIRAWASGSECLAFFYCLFIHWLVFASLFTVLRSYCTLWKLWLRYSLGSLCCEMGSSKKEASMTAWNAYKWHSLETFKYCPYYPKYSTYWLQWYKNKKSLTWPNKDMAKISCKARVDVMPFSIVTA